jgi:hypothetical protein
VPFAFGLQHERHVVEKLQAVAQRGWPIVVHPDSIHDDALWRPFGKLVCIENMDKRKPIARTRDELCAWFDRLPEASLSGDRWPAAAGAKAAFRRDHLDRCDIRPDMLLVTMAFSSMATPTLLS